MVTRNDLGGMSTEETKQLAIDAMNDLTLADRIKVVLEVFSTIDSIAELQAWLNDDTPDNAA